MNNELSRERERRFDVPAGFSDAGALGCDYTTIADYRNAGTLTVPEPGQWTYDNGTIAAVTSDGRICVWIPKSDPHAPRAVSSEQAEENLKKAGYTKANFYVPRLK